MGRGHAEDGVEPSTLTVAVAAVRGLPKQLSGTKIRVTLPDEEPRSSEALVIEDDEGDEDESKPAPTSYDLSGWQYGKASEEVEEEQTSEVVFTVKREPQAMTAWVNGRLVLELLDGDDVCFTHEVDLTPLMHDEHALGGESQVELSDDYYDDPEEGQEPPPRPPVTLVWSAAVDLPAGPLPDRVSWNTLSVAVEVERMPEGLTALGTQGGKNPKDVENHFLTYTAKILGLDFEGQLAETEPPEEDEDEDAPEPPEPRATVQFGDPQTVYRGAEWVSKFREMLDTVGGVWMKLTPVIKDPLPGGGKGKPAGAEGLEDKITRFEVNRLFVDLTGFMDRGRTSLELVHPLGEPEEGEEEEGFGTAETGLKVTLSLRFPVVPAEPPPPVVLEQHQQKLPPNLRDTPMHKASQDAGADLEAALRDALCAAGVAAADGACSKEQVLARMKASGAYGLVQDQLRDKLTVVARERLRKDAQCLAAGGETGGRFSDDQKGRVLAEVLVFAQDKAATLLRPDRPVGQPADEPAPEPPVKMEPRQDTAASDVLASAASVGATSARLAWELEHLHAGPDVRGPAMGGCARALDRAAELYQNQLCLKMPEDEKSALWIEYSRFLARCMGKADAAEEALRYTIYETADATPKEMDGAHPAVLGRYLAGGGSTEAVLNYAMLLLDRARYAETKRSLQVLLEHARSEPMHNMAMGLLLYLQGKDADAKLYVSLANKPAEWFKGLRDEKAIFDKLRLFDRDEVSDSDEDSKPKSILDPNDDELRALLFAKLLIKHGSSKLALRVLTVPQGTQPFPGLRPVTMQTCPLVEHLRIRALMSLRRWDEARDASKELLYAGLAAHGDGRASPQLWADYAECLYWLEADPVQACTKALETRETLLPPNFVDAASAVPGFRAGRALMQREQFQQAMPLLLGSIRIRPTAIAWFLVGLCAHRLQEDQKAFEALTEASVLDTEHPDVWVLLSLWHVRRGNKMLAKVTFEHMLRRPPPDLDLLLEVGWTMLDVYVPFAFAAARRYLKLRDEGPGHWLLGEAWAREPGKIGTGVLEMSIAIGMLWDDKYQRHQVLDTALALVEQLNDAPLRESVLFAQKRAELKLHEFMEEQRERREGLR